jgi:hypothetical protein
MKERNGGIGRLRRSEAALRPFLGELAAPPFEQLVRAQLLVGR